MIAAALRENEFGRFWVPAHDPIVSLAFDPQGKSWGVEMTHFLRDRCFPDGIGTLIDVGAHVGLITVPVAKKHSAVSVYAFEAHADNCALLVENLKEHGLSPERVHVMNVAAGDRGGMAELLVADDNTVDHRVLLGHEGTAGKWKEERRRRIDVSISRLDAVLPRELQHPVVLKVDAQGSDLAVLRGLGSIQPDILCFEWWPYGMVRAGETLAEAERLLSRYTHGAVLIDRLMQPQYGLHLQLIKTLPWSEASPNYFDLICTREVNKP